MNAVRRTLLSVLALLLLASAVAAPARAHGPEGEEDKSLSGLPEILQSATFTQRLGDQAPLDVTFRDETGQPVQLADYLHNGRPVILTMNYYNCDSLCPLVLEGMVKALKVIPFTVGKEYDVVTVSIDAREGPELASQVKHHVTTGYGRAGAAVSWPFLTGTQAEIDRLAHAVGFNYQWDEESQQFAHPSGVMVLTPEGRVARYIYGVEFNPRDLRLALVEASDNKIATAIDHVLLFCYRYDPATGKYGAIAMTSMRLGGLATVLALGLFLVPSLRRELRKNGTDQNTTE